MTPKDKRKSEAERPKVKGINYLIRLPTELAIELQEEMHALRVAEIQAGGRGRASIASFWREAAAQHIATLRARRLAS